jgi:hypothetical protein
MILRLTLAAAAAALFVLAVSAEAKSTKDCQKDWAANKASLTAAGQTQKAFMAQCTGKGSAAVPVKKETEKSGY